MKGIPLLTIESQLAILTEYQFCRSRSGPRIPLACPSVNILHAQRFIIWEGRKNSPLAKWSVILLLILVSRHGGHFRCHK